MHSQARLQLAPLFKIGIALLIFWVGGSVTRGDVTFDNLAPGGGLTSSDRNFGGLSRWGQQFTANSNGSFTNIKINLYRAVDNAQSPTFNIQIWSNSGVLPGTSLATLKTLNWSDLPLISGTNTSSFVEVTSFEDNYSITKDSVYWLVVNQITNGPAAHHWAINGSGLGQTASFSGTTWTNAGSTVNLGAQVTVAVPEPGTLILTGSTMVLGLGAWLGRRRSKVLNPIPMVEPGI